MCCPQVELDARGLRRRPAVELQPGVGLLEEQAYRRGGRSGVAAEMMVQPCNVVLAEGAQFGRLTVQPRPNSEPGLDAGSADRRVVAHLLRQEKVPPAGHHA